MESSEAGKDNVLRMLRTRILDNAIPSPASESENTLVRDPYGLGSSDRKMVLYILLELRRIQRHAILGVGRPVSVPLDHIAESR